MKYPSEFPAICGACGGPLKYVSTVDLYEKPGPRLDVYTWVHARHRDWLGSPHSAEPMGVELAGTLTAAALEAAGAVLARRRNRRGRVPA